MGRVPSSELLRIIRPKSHKHHKITAKLQGHTKINQAVMKAALKANLKAVLKAALSKKKSGRLEGRTQSKP